MSSDHIIMYAVDTVGAIIGLGFAGTFFYKAGQGLKDWFKQNW